METPKAEKVQTNIEPEVEEFLALLAKIAVRVLTRRRAERENGPGQRSQVDNESGSIRKS